MQSITEAKYAKTSGLNRELVRAHRKAHLAEGVDWIKRKRIVVYRPSGLILLNRHFEISAPEKKSREKKPGDSLDRLKVRSTPINKKIVLAVALNAADIARPPTDKGKQPVHFAIAPEEAQTPPLRVRVRDNSKFVPGMEMPVRHIAGDLYELACNQPRWRGRF